jgi:hypothetical protein
VKTFVELVRAELMAAQAVNDLVGQRIFPQVAPQGVDPPFVVLTTVSEIPASSFTGEPGELLRQARVQVDCYAAGYLDAHQVANAVDAVVADLSRPDLSAVRESSQDLYDDEAQLHRVSSDYGVWDG